MSKTKDLVKDDKIFAWIAAGVAVILSVPLVAMQITREVDWSLFDFIVMGTLLFGSASAFVLIARRVKKEQRLWIGLGILALVLLIWVHLAVGIVDTWPLAGS